MKNFFTGSAVGLLLGLIVGLSASDVVASVVAGLVGLLGTLLGLRSEDSGGILPGGNSARVSGFALAMIVALLAGIHVRTHGLLEPSPQQSAAAWVAAGLTQREAAQIVAFERTGLLPEGRSAGETSRSKTSTGALFSADSLDACETLQNRQYASINILTGALEVEGEEWRRLATRVPEALSATDQLRWLRMEVDKACLGR